MEEDRTLYHMSGTSPQELLDSPMVTMKRVLQERGSGGGAGGGGGRGKRRAGVGLGGQGDEEEEGCSCNCCHANKRLAPVKASYFFTLAAVASLLPYLSVYMKQLGLTPSETAIIYGTMPFLGALVRPIIGGIADKLHAHKAVLMMCCVSTGLLHAGLMFVPPVSSTNQDNDTNSRLTIECKQDNSIIKYCTDTRSMGRDCYIPPESLLNMTGTTPYPFLNTSECKLQCEFLVPEGVSDNGICFKPFRIREQSSRGAGSSSDNSDSQRQKECMSGPWDNTTKAPELEFVLEEMNHTLTQYTFDDRSGKSLVCHSYFMSAFLFNGTSYQKLFCDRVTNLHCHIDCDRFSEDLARTRCTEQPEEKDKAKFGWTFTLFFCIDLLANGAFAPIFSLIDAMTYDFLGEERGKWGKQRLWGTIGFALFGATSGLIMDFYSIDKMNIDYTVSFIAFAVLQTFTAIAVCQYKISSAVSCSSVLSNVCMLLKKLEVVVLFTLVFVLGMLNGVIETFLFWHLQNLGARQSLMGWCIVLNCLPEIPILFISGRVIQIFGHVKCLSLACVAYAARFIVYSFLKNPWFVLAVEPLHGITFGLMYAAASSYGSLITPPGMHGTMQGIIGGLFFGFGKGTGSLTGGQVFEYYGATITFQCCAAAAGLIMILYISVQLCLACRDHRQAKIKQKMEERAAAKAKEEEVKMLNTPIGWGPTELTPVDTEPHPFPRYANGMVRDSHSRTPLVPIERHLPPESSV